MGMDAPPGVVLLARLDRTASGARRSPGFLARRQIGRRQLGDQRDDLLPWPPCELRPMAAPNWWPVGHPCLELRSTAAVLPAQRGFRGGRVHAPRHGRTHRRVGVTPSNYARRCFPAWL